MLPLIRPYLSGYRLNPDSPIRQLIVGQPASLSATVAPSIPMSMEDPILSRAVKRCLGFPNFKYVWMPMSDSYFHQRVVFDRKGVGLRYLTDDGRIIPEVKEILRIIADHDLVLASGHYPYRETAPLMEEARRLGVKRMQLVHPMPMHSKNTISEMKMLASEGVKIEVMGIASVNVRIVEGIRHLFKMIKEVGADHLVWASDSGQIHNPTHLEGMRWFVKVLLAYGITKEEIEKIIKKNPAKHLGLD